MRGIKLLSNRYFSHRIIFIISLALFVIMLSLVMSFHTEPFLGADSDEDYLMCKMFGLLPTLFGTIIPAFFIGIEICGNRFTRSIPTAVDLFTNDIPLFCTILAFAWGLATNVVYASFILITGRNLCNISDMLVLTAAVGFICIVVTSIMLSSRFGIVIMIMAYLPCILLMSAVNMLPSQWKCNGFGLPLWAAVLILPATYLLAAAILALICRICYRKLNFRELSNTQGYKQ